MKIYCVINFNKYCFIKLNNSLCSVSWFATYILLVSEVRDER